MIKEGNVTIMVKDMERAVSFYQSLGLNIRQRWGNHYAMMETPGILIGLHPADNIEPKAGSVSIGFTVENIEEAKAMLEKAGIENSTRNEEGGEFIHFTDPDDTPLYFIKPK